MLRTTVRHCFASQISLDTALFDTFNVIRYQSLDLLGGLGSASRETAHLARHHREAAALLAGPRSLDSRVEREDVGLKRDAVDQVDAVGDPAACLGDALHRTDDQTRSRRPEPQPAKHHAQAGWRGSRCRRSGSRSSRAPPSKQRSLRAHLPGSPCAPTNRRCPTRSERLPKLPSPN